MPLIRPLGSSRMPASTFRDPRAAFGIADARSLPLQDATVDAVVSGLMLNFVPQPDIAITEMVRVVRPGGVVAAYVWDYREGMQLIRRFWDVAATLDSDAVELDEGRRFPVCEPSALRALFERAGLLDVETFAIEVPTRFRDFDDYWTPFLGRQGPAPGYVGRLDERQRHALQVPSPVHAADQCGWIRSSSPHARGRCGAQRAEGVVMPSTAARIPARIRWDRERRTPSCHRAERPAHTR